MEALIAAPFFEEPRHPPAPRSLWACWPDDPIETSYLPALLIVSDEDIVDFFAWGITFLPAFRPITSFFRVLPWSVFASNAERIAPVSMKRSRLLVGAILGEMLTSATGRGFLPMLPMVAFEASYSYAVSRALAIGYPVRLLRDVSDGWHHSRQIARQQPLRIEQNSLESVWSVLFLIMELQTSQSSKVDGDSVSAIADACRDLEQDGELADFHWQRLSHGKIARSLVAESMRTSKERRVETFELLVNDLARDVRDELSTAFIVGYLGSLISDGSLEHAHLVFPLIERLPTAMLWYGICAALTPRSRIMSDYDHLGLRLLRLLHKQDRLLLPPSCDIALSELKVTMRGEGRVRRLRRVHASFLRVELLPMVSVVVRWSDSTDVRDMGDQLSLFEQNARGAISEGQIRRLIASLRETLNTAEHLLRGQTAPRPTRSKDKRLR